ncbi:LolA family protein [Paracraurococcus lichenis]|uniref:Outer membrane lipoprotein carrier protein LolA n=1 Tax=Paracraurococcus lichenis TaxID=3064888 RepID=A0ABT9E171_9PROT|nr:outer membrane lipoprotein carrier protein LolA [Paracraurococcus sp. LOR1-02]MDO9709850.1 outer membrane lipoprotein carrier protein LolA [Paracraurococcus sp. LOR1-02]
MLRRSLLALPALLPALPAVAQQRPFSDRDRADIARAEAWLNRLTSLKARFLQIAQNGAASEGTGWIVRPGRMRFEYDPPEPLLLVASHGQFFYFDRQLVQATTLPIGSTPLGILLREDLRLSGEITVSRVERGGGLLRVTLFRTAAPAEGRLTLVFAEDPFELRQWAVVDAQGQETRVTLSQPEYGARYPALLFDFNDPRFREALGIQ